MTRLLTFASGGLFVTGLALLPISAFAQPASPDAKVVAPATQTTNTVGTKTEPSAKQTVAVNKDAKVHHAKPAAAAPAPTASTAPATSAASATAPLGSTTGAQTPAATSGVQPKAADHSKS
jgi:hypothetical protein